MAAGLLSLSSMACATEIYSCQYSVFDLSDGKATMRSGVTPQKVEVTGNKFKAFYGKDEGLESPELPNPVKSLRMTDNGNYVYAMSENKKDFGISNKEEKVTHQWANCRNENEPKRETNIINDAKWTYVSSKDPMTDKIRATARIISKNSGYDSINVTCTGNKDIFVSFTFIDNLLVSNSIELRIDSRKSFSEKIDISRNSSGSIGIVTNSNGLHKKLLTGENILVRAGEYNKGYVMADFSLAGYGDAIKNIKKLCGIN
ncbi:hypothetical protein [Xenorhabdus bovienii]|nr:hypothetical protein [Xenorhabdus bovienii]MDE9544763.1 hypothetical protein [Xenorhabdus bovienii]